MEVVGNERGDNIFFAIGNDEEVTGSRGGKVVLPARTGQYSWLRTSGARGAPFGISIHHLSFQCIGLSLLVQDHGHR